MTKRLRAIPMVLFVLAISTGTASALESSAEEVQDKSVIINIDGVPRMVSAEEETVGALLDTIGYLDSESYVLDGCSESDDIAENMVVNLLSTEEKVTEEVEPVEFETVRRDNNELKKGTEKVVQEGVVGIRTKTYKEIYTTNGKLVSKDLKSDTVTTKPVDKIVEIGTYVEPKPQPVAVPAAAENISGLKYKTAMNVKATGYTPYDPGCNGITATGTKAKRGSIAVDPRVIPLGTKLYIPGYGYGTAEDTGGAIKGNKIDLCYLTTSEAYSWGVRNITIYILE